MPFPPARAQAAPQEPPTPPPQEPPVAEAAPAAPPPPPPAQPEISLEERFVPNGWSGSAASPSPRRLLHGPLLNRAGDISGRACASSSARCSRWPLIAAGEWTRRKENLTASPASQRRTSRQYLTAAGTAIAYADVWAAYGLYDFIGAATAFVLDIKTRKKKRKQNKRKKKKKK